MSRRILWGWVLVALVGGSAHAQVTVTRAQIPTRSALSRLELERHWMAAVPTNATEKLIRISIADNLLFAQTDHANFYLYEAETGRLIWATTLGSRTGTAQPASANSRMVFVTNANMLYTLDRNTGRTVWTENLHAIPTSPTACDEDRVMVGLDTGMLRAFELFERDDKGLIKKDLRDQPIVASRALFAWNWQTGGGPMTSRPLPAGRLVAFAGRDGRAYVALAATPTMIYRIATGGEIDASMASHGTRTLLIPSADKNLYAVDLFTADVKWTVSTGSPVMQEPLVSDNDTYVMNAAGVLTAIDVPSGRTRWSVPTHEGRLLSVGKTRIYLETPDGDLFIVDRRTGQMLADPRTTYSRAGLNLRDYDLTLTNRLNDRIYLATSDGLIVALREMGQLRPRPLHDPAAKPFGYIPPEGIPEENPALAPLPGAVEPGAEPAPAPEPGAEPAPTEPAPGAEPVPAPGAEPVPAPAGEPK
jgi:hypothetical protein